jgi:hemerythrin-like metal-binding protein
MAYFEWGEDMVVDRGPIDADHRCLIDFVNQLHTATSRGEGRQVVEPLLDELLSYTREHFAREERLMASLRFPRIDEHGRSHRRLIDEIDKLVRLHAQGSITTAAQVSLLLRDWLSLHIRREDRELRELLKPRRR